ncbi:MAG: hypothetical protein AB1390_10135 [Nitrospirota bacterium]
MPNYSSYCNFSKIYEYAKIDAEKLPYKVGQFAPSEGTYFLGKKNKIAHDSALPTLWVEKVANLFAIL